MTLLDQLVRATLEEYALRRKFPPEKEAQTITAWIQMKNEGRCENDSC